MTPDSPISRYSIDLPAETVSIVAGHLQLGGTNPSGDPISFTNFYMIQNGLPIIPVMGEFHFSRYHHADWETELLKMKAGGIDIVATYVFWNHTEEEEGVFNWSNGRNLRHFVQLSGRHGLRVLVRIGPFAHGEVRNGGLPDWLYGRAFTVRSNDREYLAYARRFYAAIATQLDGLLFKDNGPVVGIQLENEYMHAGAPWEVTFRTGMEWVPSGRDGVDHIVQLKRIANEVGLDVPLYTCTGWLHSPIIEGEILPMQGGYAFTPWSPDPTYRQAPTREFIFRNRHLHPVLNGEPTYNSVKYPYACCEIGAGIQETYYHRPIVPPEAVEALAVVNLGDGANLIGYYMYHGGSNPVGKHGYLNEYTVPRISYDFQAPLTEAGRTADSYRRLRLLHLFLKEFGAVLAPMGVVLPPGSDDISPEDTTTLRYAVRAQGNSGFIFLNNYQDHVETQDIEGIRLRLNTPGETILVPQSGTFTLQKNVSAILPFELALEGVRLVVATAQLLTRIEQDASMTYVFFAPHGIKSEYVFEAATVESHSVTYGEIREADGRLVVSVRPTLEAAIELTDARDKRVRIITLTREQAERATKITLGGQERLLVSSGVVLCNGETYQLYSEGEDNVSLLLYPALQGRLMSSTGDVAVGSEGMFSRHEVTIPEVEFSFEYQEIAPGKVVLRLPSSLPDAVHDLILKLDYVGDMGNAYIDGQLVHDNFNKGSDWEISLRHLMRRSEKRELVIVIDPVAHNSDGTAFVPTGMAFRPDSSGALLAELRSITVAPAYLLDVWLS